MPKQKTKRPGHRYYGPYWVSTRDGNPYVHRYDPQLDTTTEGNEAALAGNAPKPESSTVAAAAPAQAQPTVTRWKLHKAEADALAESEGKRWCNRCRVTRGLECFVRSLVPYGPITDTHKSCNRCKFTSIRPASRRPTLDEFGRQFLGERDEDDDEEVDEEEKAEAMDVDCQKKNDGSETSLEEYNPAD